MLDTIVNALPVAAMVAIIIAVWVNLYQMMTHPKG